VQQRFIVVTQLSIAKLQQGIGDLFRGQKGKLKGRVYVCGGDFFQFGQRLQTALGLFGFGGFGAKAVNITV